MAVSKSEANKAWFKRVEPSIDKILSRDWAPDGEVILTPDDLKIRSLSEAVAEVLRENYPDEWAVTYFHWDEDRLIYTYRHTCIRFS